MRSNSDYFGLLTVARDAFISNINAAKARKKERLKLMQENLRPGGAAFEKERSSIYEDYKNETEKAKREVLSAIDKGFEDAKEKELLKVHGIADAAASLRVLETLRGLPVSAAEFKELCSMFAGKSVWSDKALRGIAQQNGINTKGLLEPELSEKMEVLAELKEKFEKTLEDFNIENKDVDLLGVSLSDPYIRLAEERFSGGFVNYEWSADRKAAALLDECSKERTPYMVASKVNNILETADVATARAMVERLEEKDAGYWHDILSRGAAAGLAAFKKRERAEYEKIGEECANNDLIAEVSRLNIYQKTVVKEHSGANKITRKGLDFLKSEEGKKELAELLGVNREFRQQKEEENKAAEEREQIAKEQEHINRVLNG